MRLSPSFLCLVLPGLTLLAACGGQPVGGNVPRANPAHVGGVAAAAAAAVTLADPAGAKHKTEHRGGEREARGKKVTEVVPAGVLSRSEEEEKKKDPCDKEGEPPTDSAVKGLEGVPGAEDKMQPSEACKEGKEGQKKEDKAERPPFLPAPDGS